MWSFDYLGFFFAILLNGVDSHFDNVNIHLLHCFPLGKSTYYTENDSTDILALFQ